MSLAAPGSNPFGLVKDTQLNAPGGSIQVGECMRRYLMPPSFQEGATAIIFPMAVAAHAVAVSESSGRNQFSFGRTAAKGGVGLLNDLQANRILIVAFRSRRCVAPP